MRNGLVILMAKLTILICIIVAAAVYAIDVVLIRLTLYADRLAMTVALCKKRHLWRFGLCRVHHHVFCRWLAVFIPHSADYTITYADISERYAALVFFLDGGCKIFIFSHIVIESDGIAVCINFFETDDSNHRLFAANGTVEIVHIRRLFPRRNDAFVVVRANLVYKAQSLIGLTAAGIVVTAVNPLELSADAIFCRPCLAHLQFEKIAGAVFGISLCVERLATVKVEGSPCAILAIQQLLVVLQFLIVPVGMSAVSSAPVLNYVPIRTLAAVAGSYQSHIGCGWVHLTDDF